jgi:hypothetical protein
MGTFGASHRPATLDGFPVLSALALSRGGETRHGGLSEAGTALAQNCDFSPKLGYWACGSICGPVPP